ncbi:MAG: hypothetical protein HHJ15_04080 [Rhodoferax sp.]|uniref:hypothetical protein n=1 Tax=Rhodoferax sp. TaxID=50421 RepID=UPI0017BD42F8|nr:hypothetical protein [Rhodoferax sp.]NMM19129.1 hypothetical protein [Rhodoferax sp.]
MEITDFWLKSANLVASYVDGSWLDIFSFIFALVYVRRQWGKKPELTRGPFLCRDIGFEFANAASIFPLFLLTLTVFSTKLTVALLTGNKIILAIAGGFALFSLLEDRSVQSAEPIPVAKSRQKQTSARKSMPAKK